MKILDPGHRYQLDQFDGAGESIVQFMKREGPGYPGNIGTSAGTNMQEVLRALIDRLIYVDGQIPDSRNLLVIQNLRDSLWLLEERAAERHGLALERSSGNVEAISTCLHCGHIACPHIEQAMAQRGAAA